MPSSDAKQKTRIQEIRIELPKHMPPILEKNVNIGFMVEFKTRDIPSIRSDKIIITSINIYNWRGIGKDFLERSHLLTPIAGELRMKYPLDTFVLTTCPRADKQYVDTIKDEIIAQKASYELYNVGRLDEYMPIASRISVQWDLDKHIQSWFGNKVSFASIAEIVQ
ncbi:MAG: hypothetical protein PVF58_18460 [Candidatus Methanofastidiosia archaeon]|jgi:hypothetical protein